MRDNKCVFAVILKLKIVFCKVPVSNPGFWNTQQQYLKFPSRINDSCTEKKKKVSSLILNFLASFFPIDRPPHETSFFPSPSRRAIKLVGWVGQEEGGGKKSLIGSSSSPVVIRIEPRTSPDFNDLRGRSVLEVNRYFTREGQKWIFGQRHYTRIHPLMTTNAAMP